MEVAMRDIAHHKELRVWQEAMQLALDVYKASAKLPAEERFGLKMQMRRAVSSIPANISEGAGRGTRVEFARYVVIARGSLSELETHLLLCERLEFLDHDEIIHSRIHKLRLMLSKLRNALIK
jgi:four helix bundle protein